MKKTFIAILTTFMALQLPLYGDILHFRSGEIVAAEISENAPDIRNLNTDAFPTLPEKRIYAVLSIKLSPGRQISIFDYSLESRGVTYPCVAISTGGNFVSSEKNFSGDILQLLFILESRRMPHREDMNIKCNLPPTDGTYDIIVPFKNIGHRSLVRASRIPEKGLLETLK